jgi:hypothetical protein
VRLGQFTVPARGLINGAAGPSCREFRTLQRNWLPTFGHSAIARGNRWASTCKREVARRRRRVDMMARIEFRGEQPQSEHG